MPARKIPIIWSSSKEKDPIYFRYAPQYLRLVKLYPPVPIIPTPLVVGVGNGTNTLFYSEDKANTWTGLGNTVFTNSGYGVRCNGNIWVAVGDGTNSIAYSRDGKNWTGLGTSILTTGYSVYWNGTTWLVGGPQKIAYSSDGVNWTGVAVANLESIRSISWNGTTWVVVGNSASGSDEEIAYSSDLINWNYIAVTNAARFNDIVYYDSKFTAVGSFFGSSPVNTKAYSSDITNWTTITATNGSENIAIEKFNSTYFSLSLNSGAETSSDGLTWSSATDANLISVAGSPPSATFYGRGIFFFCDQKLFLCGNNQLGYTSDGINWSKIPFSVAGSSIFAAYSFE